jgi:hypothetical protein
MTHLTRVKWVTRAFLLTYCAQPIISLCVHPNTTRGKTMPRAKAKKRAARVTNEQMARIGLALMGIGERLLAGKERPEERRQIAIKSVAHVLPMLAKPIADNALPIPYKTAE